MTNRIEYMSRALQLAQKGEGSVEPNPMVGCVIVNHGRIIGEGYHECFGDAHAEIHAIHAAGKSARQATMYVTLEPCCHHGKTPPCADAIIAAGIQTVYVAHQDPNPQVAGKGIQKLREADIDVHVGLGEHESAKILAPFITCMTKHRPWVLAKWAMTLDGKIATVAGDSRWISNEKSRAMVHRLRGRMDGIMVGCQTALRDDPSLTARPPGPRTATRIITDSDLKLSVDSQLAKTARETPVLIFCKENPDGDRQERLEQTGCEIVPCMGDNYVDRLRNALLELGKRKMTNILVEGGSHLMATFFEANVIDEVWTYVCPKIVGGRDAVTPVSGPGIAAMASAIRLEPIQYDVLDGDLFIKALVR